MKSNGRIAELLVRLMNGETLTQSEVQQQYEISLRTCQRDFAEIRRALTEYSGGELIESEGNYRLIKESATADFEAVLAASNILIGSRVFTNPELNLVLDSLKKQLNPELQLTLQHQLSLTKGSYVPLSKPKPLLQLLRQMTDWIAKNRKLVFTYQSSQKNETKPLLHHAQPVAIFFETYYFYVAMLSEERNGYWLYRLDRIVDVVQVGAGESLDYAERFSLQDHRRQTYLLDSGSLTKIRFIYRYYAQTVLDHFPGSRVVKQNEDGSYVIEAYVKIDGAMLWLLSQGNALQIISPPSLVERMKKTLKAAYDQYAE